MVKLLKSIYRKIKWILTHFKQIDYTQKLVPTSSVTIPNYIFHGPITYQQDGLVTSNNCDFIQDPRFIQAYTAAQRTEPWPNFTLQWRVYIVCWFSNMVKSLNGDFVECGVNTGAYAIALIKYIDFERTGKSFYLFDTFKGLEASQISEAEKKEGIEKYLKGYKNVYEQVKATFSPYPNIKIIRGLVPDSLPECKSSEICFLSIDMNVVKPEIDAVNYFWPKMVKGGVIILDDYGFPQHINQKLAFDAFARSHNVEILSLPTGQGIIIKL